ncbi:MarR family winged helix-turn-helix transcriptional regulator [Kineococcus sp. SYSU DK003]|uniref:MarR family winged helix-turn-helix transcriptional regulator n=1 Tax=Kineococcus sp. SYSU DK003 TaxID=3383124 RepID=UPI003D7CF8FA
MTSHQDPPVTGTGPPAAAADAAHEQQVAALADAVDRQLRTLHALKAQVARGQSDVERAMHVVLHVLADAGPLRVGALAERLGTDPSTTSRQTAELAERALLRRLPDPEDRRASLLDVTEAGHTVVTAMRRRRHDHLARAVEDFDDGELAVFTDLLSRFTAGLERHTEHLRTTHAPQEHA